MDELIRGIRVLHHSAIRIEAGGKVLYFDPFGVKDTPHDADYILITHDHYDHLSPEDIEKVSREDTVLLAPASTATKAKQCGLAVLPVQPGQRMALPGMAVHTVPAYNIKNSFHPKANGWVGYVAEVGDCTYYVAGDTDHTPESDEVRCDVALLPVGGTYTMNAAEAAALAKHIRPRTVIPTHYGSVVGSATDAEEFARLLGEDVSCKVLMEEL